MRAAAAILILCAGAAAWAEQIRIEVARGKRSARVEAGGRMHALAAEGAGLTLDGKPVASAQFTGPLRLDGRELPGRLEVFSERGALGEVLTWGAAPIAAYFSASCGGRSESAEAAFHLASGTAPYLRAGEPDGDERGWTVRVPLAEITAALRKARRMHAEVRDIAVESRTASGRAQGLAVETSAGRRPLPAVELRQLL